VREGLTWWLPQMDGVTSDSYLGHYVVVVGYEATQGAFLVRDPASASPLVLVSDERLEAARKAFGTDEDILLVSASEADHDVEWHAAIVVPS